MLNSMIAAKVVKSTEQPSIDKQLRKLWDTLVLSKLIHFIRIREGSCEKTLL